MTTLKFRGSSFSYQPTQLVTPIDENTMKYRGLEYAAHRSVTSTSQEKGLKFRGVAY